MKLDFISQWCLYRERSLFETRNFLLTKGVSKTDMEHILKHLTNENLINDCRFARAYVSGKIRINKWGKQKVLAGLYKHHISAKCIDVALNQVEENEYLRILNTHIASRIHQVSREQLIRWLIGKGFEYQLIVSLISKQL